ncbi:hypothetical protein [uncultured Brachyspira sp.]|uniref:hypothetical protein n=1 Tax=uncultured Brachyspira sp. TaxID=221953 RepID=UPI00260F7226|nr:hypothetical protein [uncultured Brachyspira sp.]
MSLSLFENMYYKLPENEREVFLNGLNKEDRENLLLNVGKKIVNESISDSQKEYFNNIYNSIEDLKIKNSFLNILFILDDDKREALLKILSSKYKCKNTDYIYNYHIKEIGVYEKGLFFNSHIKNILNKDDINYSEDNNFNRILYTLISYDTLEIFKIILNKKEIDFEFDEVFKCIHINKDDFSSIKNNISNINENELKSFYMLKNIPNKKRLYFFEIFENNQELNSCIDIKILRYLFNINEEAFLSIFDDDKKYYLEKEIKTNNYVFIDIYGEDTEYSLSNIINYLTGLTINRPLAVGFHGPLAVGLFREMFRLNRALLADVVKAFETENTKLLKKYFIRIIEIIIIFNSNYLLNTLENLYKHDNDFLMLSQLIPFANIKEYLNILKNKGV